MDERETMTKLEPCPFCGAPAHMEDDVPPRAGYKIHASCGPDCKVQPSVWAEYTDEAIAAWNRRTLRSVEPAPKLPQTISYHYRHQRADVLTAHIMHVIAPFLCDHGEARGPRDVSRLLRDIFYSSGVEIISDADRERAGLHPRDENGLTREELHILEMKRLELMFKPAPSMVLPIKGSKP